MLKKPLGEGNKNWEVGDGKRPGPFDPGEGNGGMFGFGSKPGPGGCAWKGPGPCGCTGG